MLRKYGTTPSFGIAWIQKAAASQEATSGSKYATRLVRSTSSRSRYVWLISDRDHALRIISTANADNPLTKQQIPLLTCDL
jgi:superoxide dismutase